MSFQKNIMVGNLGSDPEMRFMPNGNGVTNFSMATNRSYTNSNGERVKETTWFRVTTWGRLAETCNEYLRKGSQVLVEGRLNSDPETCGPRIWIDNSGTPRAQYEVTAETVVFMGSREVEYDEPDHKDYDNDDSIPF